MMLEPRRLTGTQGVSVAVICDPTGSLRRRLEQADHRAVGILCDRDDFSVADVGGVLDSLGAGVDERLEARGRVIDRPVCKRARGAALVAVRVQTDLELA